MLIDALISVAVLGVQVSQVVPFIHPGPCCSVLDTGEREHEDDRTGGRP